MQIWDLIAALSVPSDTPGGEPVGARRAARDRLAATGSVAVVPVLAALREGTIGWDDGVEVLRRVDLAGFGAERPAVAALLEQVVAATGPAGVAGAGAELWDGLVEVARWQRDPHGVPRPALIPDPDPLDDDREAEPRFSWAPVFVPLLVPPEPCPYILYGPEANYEQYRDYRDTLDRYRAMLRFLAQFGDEVVPMLRTVRRSRLRQRREALLVLAEIGWSRLEARDQALMRRFLAFAAAREPADEREPKAYGEWYAVRTDDRDAVLAAFGLSDPVVVPASVVRDMWFGLEQPEDLGRDPEPGWDGWPWLTERVGVSPVIDGWTLVFGIPFPEEYHDREETLVPGIPAPGDHDGLEEAPREVVVSELGRLSRLFGEAAHFRFVDDIGDPLDFNKFRLAADSELVCAYEMDSVAELVSETWVRLGVVDQENYDEWLHRDMQPKDDFPRGPGESELDWIRRYWQRYDENDGPVEQWTLETPFLCSSVASKVTAWFGPGRRIEGAAMLALTERGRGTGHRGLLPLGVPKG